MKRLRAITITIIILVLLLQILSHLSGDEVTYNLASRDYYVEMGLKETSSKNLVTGIYLDYRLFDSFFEASLLLVVVTGIAFIAIKDEDLL